VGQPPRARTTRPTTRRSRSPARGKKLIGGGARLYDAGGDVALDESYPSSATTWHATGYEINATLSSWYLIGYAISTHTGS
jgi:hypothetical protein